MLVGVVAVAYAFVSSAFCLTLVNFASRVPWVVLEPGWYVNVVVYQVVFVLFCPSFFFSFLYFRPCAMRRSRTSCPFSLHIACARCFVFLSS